MAATGFAYSHLFAKDLPAAAPRWTGFPKYNFIGGDNDREHVPAAALAAAAEAVLRREGADLASTTRMARRASSPPATSSWTRSRGAASTARPTRC